MITAEQKIAALEKFKGDVIIYQDGSVLLRSTDIWFDKDAYGPTWDIALEHLVKNQRTPRTS